MDQSVIATSVPRKVSIIITWQIRLNQHLSLQTLLIYLYHYTVISDNILDGMTTFDGYCRYGSGKSDSIKLKGKDSVSTCQKECAALSNCTAFVYRNYEQSCFLYRNGPYTYGDYKINTKCFLMPYNRSTKVKIHNNSVQDYQQDYQTGRYLVWLQLYYQLQQIFLYIL